MNKTWTNLCQKNVDHYNNHKTTHNAATAAYGVAVLVVLPKIIKRIAGADTRP